MNKYKLTKETKVFCGITLYRIMAVSDFANVKAGELGGFIEKENNLSQNGSSWVSGDARVSGNALVSGDARVSGNARVFGNALVSGDARVSGNARVFGNALVSRNDQIFWISNIGSRSGTITFFLCADKKIRTKCGCFYGDLDEFSSRVQTTHGGNRHGQTYRLAIEMARTHIVIPDGELE